MFKGTKTQISNFVEQMLMLPHSEIYWNSHFVFAIIFLPVGSSYPFAKSFFEDWPLQDQKVWPCSATLGRWGLDLDKLYLSEDEVFGIQWVPELEKIPV